MLLFENGLPKRSTLREKITAAYCTDETNRVDFLLNQLPFVTTHQTDIQKTAADLVHAVRSSTRDQSGVEALMSQYDLSSEEGIVLMCLAEALLRIPDRATEELLIKDKLTSAKWEKYVGVSRSRFVNIATLGLAFTGKVLSDDSQSTLFGKAWYGMLSRLGEPMIRQAIRHTMKVMSEHFVLGRTITEALNRSQKLAEKGYLFSFDMLGEMARTADQAQKYFEAYQQAISAIGRVNHRELHAYLRPTISIKLSALDPRYEFSHREVTVAFLTQQLKSLALEAKAAGIHLTVDAEEAARLESSLDIFEAVFSDPDLKDWDGLGLAVQAYQKRAYPLIEWLIDLARTYDKRLSVRLVKGAYWDTEIKLAQVSGFDGYPVFTRKASTDVSYLACAELLLSAPNLIYPQFATHNAYTAAAILCLTKNKSVNFEFQNLQGMGGPLHNVLVSEKYGVKSRIYAPVGQHKDLLPYLVRRLLENGANMSFVHQIANPSIPIHQLIKSPIEKIRACETIENPFIALPKNIYPSGRQNAKGFDITREDQLQLLQQQMRSWESHLWEASSCHRKITKESRIAILNPNDQGDVVGYVTMADTTEMIAALDASCAAFAEWDLLGVNQRATYLEVIADLLEQNFAELCVLLMREAGKFFPDCIAEIREAVDFCRYYALMAKTHLQPEKLPGSTGESNTLRYHGRGTMLCVSPWNFPLAIFTGQVAASLVAGNCVIAKPASQTPLIAATVVSLMHQAGVPKTVLQLMPGSGAHIGNTLIADARIAGVLFTGSTETAKTIQRTLANREGEIVPLIAETGGINAMIADSSALLEQLVGDVMISAFGSAGQRCSALRVVCVQEDIADAFNEMLQGAMQTWHVGDSRYLHTDVGPVIDRAAQKTLQEYIDEMREKAHCIAEMDLSHEADNGTFIAPVAFEVADLSAVTKEVFGPVLHVLRFKRKNLDQLIDQLNAKGYGLTFGIQSRIDQTINHLQKRIRTGNIYVNRTMIGAVVGVQPFGGCGLSGTGPKAGGPHYLSRLVRESTLTINTTAMGGNAELLVISEG